MIRSNPVAQIILTRTAWASILALALHWLGHWPLTGPHALGLFLTPALCLYFVWVFVAPWSWGLPIQTRLRTRERIVVLTFDDGPSPQTTPLVLAALRARGVQATFFVLGEAVDHSPDLLRQIVAEGHAVGLHAYRHRPFVGQRLASIEAEISRTREAVARACPGAPIPFLLRPPHGFKSLRGLWAARRAGCRLVAWNLDGRDYRERAPDRIAARVIHGLRPGAIILLHDGPDNAATAEALTLLLPAFQSQGYCCVPLTSGSFPTPP